MSDAGLTVEGPLLGQSAVCMPVLRALPRWFGIEHALLDYEREIDELPTFLARRAGSEEVVGFVSIKRHFPESAELYVLGVLPSLHRQGVGRAMLACVEDWLRSEGVEYVHLKTRGPSKPDEGYERTRAFYTALGYRPLEELPTLWNEENPALLLVNGCDVGCDRITSVLAFGWRGDSGGTCGHDAGRRLPAPVRR